MIAQLGLILLILAFSNGSLSIPAKIKLKQKTETEEDFNCNLPQSLVDEIKSYEGISKEIIFQFLHGSLKGKSYTDLEEMILDTGSRFSGTPALERSIDLMRQRMETIGLQNVHTENVTLPQWVRGFENLEIISPRRLNKKVSILGLGWSIGTPQGGIEAEIIVVKDFDELRSRSSEVQGKIVIFNSIFETYAITSPFRKMGATEAAKYGAVASLTRSVGPLSINSPHTGGVFYEENVMQIPAASLTIEDADLFQRLDDKGEKVILRLVMNDYLLQPVVSRNLIGEIPGREKPNEIVIVSAHIDSWDVGQGAMDDGGGVTITMKAMELLNALNIKPRRTLRAILWTGEEMGFIGAKEYAKRHLNKLQDISILMEADAATFKPLGLGFHGSDEAGCIIKEISKLLAPINATSFKTFEGISSDYDVFIPYGVPGISLRTDLTKRYWYHHTEGDTLTVENSDELDLCAAAWTVTAYVLADMKMTIPRDMSIT